MVIRGYKIRLLPTVEQEVLIKKSVGVSRFIYNWCLDRQLKSDSFISDNELGKDLTQLKKTSEYYWLNEVSNCAITQSVRDLCNAYKRFFNHISNKPRFKKKGVRDSFYVRYNRMKRTKHGVRCEKIGDIKTSERLPNLKEGKHYITHI